MRKRTKLTYVDYGKTVCVGDELTVKWANGRLEKRKVADFSPISNEPIDDTGRLIFLEYVVW